ncbi:uncharacterized protein LOC131051557 [Cryptomeria japonica]|uniref:uncharacterized protein LOC131051557 n=1 Tax=Cryptomeria japonica TaxID=3369 RepID=UPI0027DA7B55|nr:uncharacterized protein LOC131051557 [Cryptomeria japonica]
MVFHLQLTDAPASKGFRCCKIIACTSSVKLEGSLAEGLGRFLKYRVSQGQISGWRWGHGLPHISHLQFVDDTVLMGLARLGEAVSFRGALDTYLAALGQKVNDHKFSIFFFNTPHAIQRRVADILDFQIGSLPVVYLGIPITVCRQPRTSWWILLDKPRQKIQHWTHPWLSTAARLTLLKSVIQTLPIYRCFIQAAPMYFLQEFDALSRQFLWSGNLSTSKWSLLKWETVCRPKAEGGLGLRLTILNGKVLAANLFWRWYSYQDQLWARILNHKYLNNICHGGSQALFWLDSWDGHPPIISTFPHLQHLCDPLTAAGWNNVGHYKEAFNCGLGVTFRWKQSSQWPPGDLDDDRAELSRILGSRQCPTLTGNDILAWESSDSSEKFVVSTGYGELLR